MSKKFNITMYPQEEKTNLLFDGFIMVDENNLITGVYENSDPTVNVILPMDDVIANPDADNIFNGFFSVNGVNFTSTKIYDYYSAVYTSNHVNLSTNFIITQYTIIKKLYGTVVGTSTINSSICLSQPDIDDYTYPINVTGTAENPTVITLSSDIIFRDNSLTFYVGEDQHVLFNGCGYYVKASSVTNYCGMFVSNSEHLKILNLNIQNDIDNPSTLDKYCGWIGSTFFNGTIENCSSDGELTSIRCGGIVGSYAGSGIISGYCKISNCNTSGNILGFGSGGICGGRTGNGGKFIVNNCYSTGSIIGENSGGIIGNDFGNIDGSLNIDNSYNVISNCYSTGDITGTGAGGIVGSDASTNKSNSTCEIKGCYSVGLIGGASAGGIVGPGACFSVNQTMTVTNCYSIGNINGAGAGGIVGSNCSNGGILTLTNCYSTGNISSGTGGIVGDLAVDNNGECNISNCYTIGTKAVGGFDIVNTQYGATVTNCKHSTAGWSDTDGNTYLQPNNVWKKVSIPSVTNQPWKIFSNILCVNLLPNYVEKSLSMYSLFPDSIYSNVILTTILTDSSGNTKSDDSTGTNFDNVKYSDGDNEFYIKITAIEDGDETGQTYYKVGDYINYIQLSTLTSNTTITQSNIDNYNYPIRVLGTTKITIGENIVGSSGQNISFTVPENENVTITGGNNTITITDVSNYLGLVSTKSETCIVENIGVLSINSYIDIYGWIISNYCKGTVRNCYSNGDISGYGSGGIVGSTFASINTAVIDKCYSTGIISGLYCGGIAGYSAGTSSDNENKCTISNCYSTAVIAGPGSGGITGGFTGGFEFGDIKGNCTVSYCHSIGDIVGSGSGGISGGYTGFRGNCTITNCYSTGSINGITGGGIAGDFTGTGNDYLNVVIRGNCIITDCYTTGAIGGDVSGGIVGRNAGTGGDCIITNCYSTGIINGNGSGGIAGFYAGSGGASSISIDCNCSITNCYSTGIINSGGGITGSQTADIAGLMVPKCTITNCYSTGIINGGGGITGPESSEYCTITNCYTIGDISGTDSAGILGTRSNSIITNCYTTGITASDAFNIVDTKYGAKVTNSDHSLGWSDSVASKYLIPLSAWKKVTPTTITNQPWKLDNILKSSVFTVDAINKTVTYKSIFPINILYKSEKLTLHLENESGAVISDSIVVNISQENIVFTNVVLIDTSMNIYIVIETVEPIILSTKTINTGYYNSGDYMDYYYNVVPTTTSTTTEPPICYNKGTKILCLTNDLRELYTPIENITKGMLVQTYKHGYRRVEFIGSGKLVNNPNKTESCMYILPQQGDMIDNLIVTGGHSILVDNYPNVAIREQHKRVLMGNIKIDDKYLLLASVSAGILKPIINNSTFTYYHLVLESDDEEIRYGIWANGVLSETVSKKEFIKRNYNRI